MNILVYFLVFSLTLLLIKLIIAYAPQLGLVDLPNHRSVHQDPTPRGAGIGIFLAVAIIFPFFYFSLFSEHLLSFLAIFVVFLIGLLDDHRDAPPRAKLIFIGIAIFLIYIDGIQVNSFKNIMGIELSLGILSLPITLLLVISFTNAFNIVDGIDGLAGTLGIIILGTLLVIGLKYDDLFIISLASCYIAGIIAFLCFNWNPARIFMGDSGSLTIGFLIALLSIKAIDYIQPVAILFIAAIPVIDMFIIMIRRKRNGQKIFAPDRNHLHHIALFYAKGKVKQVVLFFAAVQLFLSMIGLYIIESHEQLYALLLFLILLIIVYMISDRLIKAEKWVKKTKLH